MKTWKHMAWLAGLMVAGAAGCPGQSRPDIPPGPLINKQPADMLAWTVKCEYEKSGQERAAFREQYEQRMAAMAAQDPVVAKLLATRPQLKRPQPRLSYAKITKTTRARREIWGYESGQKGERWFIGKQYITKDPFDGKMNYQMEADIAPKGHDFPEFAWVSEKNFSKIDKVEDRKCMIFEAKVKRLQLEDPHLYGVIRGVSSDDDLVLATAAVDVDTRLPVALKWEDQSRLYTFTRAPAADIPLPPDLKEFVKDTKSRAEARSGVLAEP